jgi:hypothetical protein
LVGETGRGEAAAAQLFEISEIISFDRKPGVRVLTLDLYGTIANTERGLTDAIAPYLAAKGRTGRPASLVTWWQRTHFESSMIDA